MNEIDDLYKQETEDLDSEFLEKVKDVKSRDALLGGYLRNLKRTRNRYYSKYSHHLKREKRKILNPKVRKKKKEKLKHLKVKHFELKLGFFQKAKINLNIFFFDIKRILSKTWAKIVPRIFLYLFYKLIKTVSFYYRTFTDWTDKKKRDTKSSVKKFFTAIVDKIKTTYGQVNKSLKEFIGKINFLKKKKGEEGSDEEKKEGEEKKDEESS